MFVDIYCYRNYGHNEADEPAFTQPVMYAKIISTRRGHASTRRASSSRRHDRGRRWRPARGTRGAAREQSPGGEVRGRRAATGADKKQVHRIHRDLPAALHARRRCRPRSRGTTLAKIGAALTHVPEDFKFSRSSRRRFSSGRAHVGENGGPFDWADGEALAFGSLLLEGTPVRLTGQDSRRGTFSHRHSVFTTWTTRERYVPLNNLAGDQAQFCVYNSRSRRPPCSASTTATRSTIPQMLCIWEAQFGDFANGAQVIIDQFIAAAESKWQRPSGIVLLLPHGYEGQGPEHSSARLERFLQSARRTTCRSATSPPRRSISTCCAGR